MTQEHSVRQSTVASQRGLEDRLLDARHLSQELASPLSAEDMTVQAMDDASPTKWHLAHVTWFFETFVLAKHLPGYRVFDETFNYCFNSYYESLGSRQPRPKRGILTRPPIDQVFAYRSYVDEALSTLFARDIANDPEVAHLVEVGVNHEQQHQELLLTDILALFSANPLRPAYSPRRPRAVLSQPDIMSWLEYPGGIFEVGHSGDGFAWDNERPRHEVLIHPFRLSDRLVTNAEWFEFIEDGGYETASLWLSDGWATINREGWKAPLYWEHEDGQWFAMSLEGPNTVEQCAPVCHVSYFEADAFARWAGKRLPTEFEWEVAARDTPESGNSLATRAFRPLPANSATGQPRQISGDVWEWTQSAYLPYPGYRPPAGALGEYNGKFMVNQQVLRGGSCATPPGHTRATYRNFFYPHQRWQFVGLRLASELN